MNKVILLGNVTAEPVMRTAPATATRGETLVANYRLAVSRDGRKNAQGQNEADFINCVCFGKSAEFVQKYLHKGTKILVEGAMRSGSYQDKDGRTVYTTDVYVDRHEFAGAPTGAPTGAAAPTAVPAPVNPAPAQAPAAYAPAPVNPAPTQAPAAYAPAPPAYAAEDEDDIPFTF